MLAPGREEALSEFIKQYETVRLGEGRRIQGADHLRALPFRDLSRARPYEWYIRSKSFSSLIRRVVRPLERERTRLRILDVGSGVGWLAHRLASRGHEVGAVDIVTNDFDGLGVHRRWDHAFVPIQAEFDRLPLVDRSVDLVVYNAAFHYATDFATTLREALRVLGAGGRLVIMDSPLYRDGSSGERMVREREDAWALRYGFRGSAIRAEAFLTYDRLATLEEELHLTWEIFVPWYGLRWALKPWVARLLGRREPARFKLIVGFRAHPASPLEPPSAL
jgi:SAM-dependent methyltransferase